MRPQEAVNEKFRVHETPNMCYGCKHAYNDMEEGWNCRKYHSIIIFSDGSKMPWPCQACDRAFNSECHGHGFKRAVIPAYFRRYPFVGVAVVLVLSGFIMINFACPK